MKTREAGQVIVIAAVFILIILLILGMVIDSTRLMIEKQELDRAAAMAGKAGLIVVGDMMVTQVVGARATLPALPAAPAPPDILADVFSPTPTPEGFLAWLTDGHRSTLVAQPMQTLVSTQVLGSLEENGLGFSNPSVDQIEITYPYQYHPEAQKVQIKVQVRSKLVLIFAKLLGLEEGVLSGNSIQNIPQR